MQGSLTDPDGHSPVLSPCILAPRPPLYHKPPPQGSALQSELMVGKSFMKRLPSSLWEGRGCQTTSRAFQLPQASIPHGRGGQIPQWVALAQRHHCSAIHFQLRKKWCSFYLLLWALPQPCVMQTACMCKGQRPPLLHRRDTGVGRQPLSHPKSEP